MGCEIPIMCGAMTWVSDYKLVGAIHIARSEIYNSQGFIYDRRVVGLQFHLEATRQSAELLIEKCGDEIVTERFIQSSNEILSDKNRFINVNRLIDTLLENLSLFFLNDQ